MNDWKDDDFDESGTRKDAGTFECAVICFGALCALAGMVLGLILGGAN